jgi:2-iminobutanoate/2-iminopropanoate deaminase
MITRHLPTPIMHRAVAVGGLVFLGGTVADDATLPMAGQTKQILDKIDGYLAIAGSDKSKVVAATIFVTDLTLKKEMDAVWTAWLGTDLCTRATVGVADLGPGILIEIVVTAAA